MTTEWQIEESIPLPIGFRASGIRAGIKRKEARDMTLLVSDAEAAVAGTFTTNQVRAASVKLCQERIAGGRGRAVVINSGNANACTGTQGVENARTMARLAGEALGIAEEDVFACSTGPIGVQLPMDIVESGIARAAEALSADGGLDAAHGIMTTDTRPKFGSVKLSIDGRPVTLSGLAKGSGMIHPNMATMLAYILTDAAVEPGALQQALSEAVAGSFNRISVDGDTSTNDTCLCFANGRAENDPLQPDHPDWPAFVEGLKALCHYLAMKMVQDGEGMTKQVTVTVRGAESDDDADTAARSVVNSIEVRTSWTTNKAGWGRVMHALGYSQAIVVEEKVDIDYDGLPAVRAGMTAGTPAEDFIPVLNKGAFAIDINLNLGDGEAVIYSCDCTQEYVRLNTY